MNLAIVIVIAAALALVLILRITVSRSLRVSSGSNLAGKIQPIDIDAFRNLVDPAEREYLRLRLSSSDFRRVHRARLRAMSSYVQEAGRNAATLIQIGEAALAVSDPRTAGAARELINNALLLRRNAALALIRIHIALALPNAALGATSVIDGYQQLSSSAMLLGRLQNPAAPVRISVLS
jgi:hypothetical protein